MPAFVVDAPRGSTEAPLPKARLNLFPGSALPAMFAAGTAFWIGYGFAADDGDRTRTGIPPGTRFDLVVDGEAVALQSEAETDHGRTVRLFSVAVFPQGLPAGWHDFSCRWYDACVLALTSHAAVEFVER